MVVEYPHYTTSDRIVTTCEMAAVVHWRPCLQHLACCSVNSRHVGSESRFLPTRPAFDAPVKGIPSEYRHPVWYGKTRMVWLLDSEKISKISLFVLTQSTNVTDTHIQTDIQTPHDDIGRAYASHRAAKIMVQMTGSNLGRLSLAAGKTLFNLFEYRDNYSATSNKKCGRRVRPTRYASTSLLWHMYSIEPRRLRLITWPCDLDLWPWRSWRLWLMRVVVLHPYTKFEVRRPCRSEDMAHDVCQH